MAVEIGGCGACGLKLLLCVVEELFDLRNGEVFGGGFKFVQLSDVLGGQLIDKKLDQCGKVRRGGRRQGNFGRRCSVSPSVGNHQRTMQCGGQAFGGQGLLVDKCCSVFRQKHHRKSCSRTRETMPQPARAPVAASIPERTTPQDAGTIDK